MVSPEFAGPTWSPELPFDGMTSCRLLRPNRGVELPRAEGPGMQDSRRGPGRSAPHRVADRCDVSRQRHDVQWGEERLQVVSEPHRGAVLGWEWLRSRWLHDWHTRRDSRR
jgi:hypothetical protein